MSGTVTLDKEEYDGMVETLRQFKGNERKGFEVYQKQIDALIGGGAYDAFRFYTSEEVMKNVEKRFAEGELVHKARLDHLQGKLDVFKAKVSIAEESYERLLGRNLIKRILNRP